VDKIPVLKVVIAGDGNVGKTSLVRRYCEGKFDASRVATIGVDFQTKIVELPDRTVKLSIWDMAGQDRFRVVRSGFYRGSLGTALVYDVTDPISLENLVKWYNEIVGITPGQKFIVIGNKIDLERVSQAKAATALAARIEAPYLETSALSGDGVPEMFTTLATLAASHLASPQNEKID
jgi:small GTP-binding protein